MIPADMGSVRSTSMDTSSHNPADISPETFDAAYTVTGKIVMVPAIVDM